MENFIPKCTETHMAAAWVITVSAIICREAEKPPILPKGEGGSIW